MAGWPGPLLQCTTAAGERLSSAACDARTGRPEKPLSPSSYSSQGLGSAVVQLLAGSGGLGQLRVTYASPRGDDLDTRLLRANILKGILESITDQNVNLVNADYLAEQYNIEVVETVVKATSRDLLSSVSVEVAAKPKFSGCLNGAGRIELAGAVIKGSPFITRVGTTDVEVEMSESVILTKQRDQPGVIGTLGTTLSGHNINISFMTVGRRAKRTEAIMAVGVDEVVSDEVLAEISKIRGIEEACALTFPNLE